MENNFRQLQAPSNAMLPRKKWPQRPKKKKLKKPAKRPIITPSYTRRHFEELKENIVTFTLNSQFINRRVQGRELERGEIDQQWTGLIQGILPADDSKSYELLAQVECPMYDAYWEKRADEKAFFEREHRFELCAFNKPRRNPSQAQRQNWPGCVLMEDIELREILVPRVSLLALQQVNYLDFVKSVLQANPRRNISRFAMEGLCVAVVTKIFHFEDTVAKELKIGETNECTPAAYRALAADYRSAYEAAIERVETKRHLQERKKREREDNAGEKEKGSVEGWVEEEELGNYDEDDRAAKRQKIQGDRNQDAVIGQERKVTGQHLGEEEEDVGAFHFNEVGWKNLGGDQDAPVTFHFADTGLAFRFKG